MFWELELLIDLPLNFPFYLRNFSLPIGQNGSENFTRKKIFIGKTEKMKQKNLQICVLKQLAHTSLKLMLN